MNTYTLEFSQLDNGWSGTVLQDRRIYTEGHGSIEECRAVLKIILQDELMLLGLEEPSKKDIWKNYRVDQEIINHDGVSRYV